jgi:hypothetical protein
MKLKNNLMVAGLCVGLLQFWSLPSRAMLSLNSGCATGFVICWTYYWSGQCNDGTAVGGESFWASDIGTDATNACAGHGGLVVGPPDCPSPFNPVEGLCVLRTMIPAESLSKEEQRKLGSGVGSFSSQFSHEQLRAICGQAGMVPVGDKCGKK